MFCVVINEALLTEDYNALIKNEELIGTTEYLTV